MAVLRRLGRRRHTGAGGSTPAPVDPRRVLRRRRSPLQLTLGGTLILLILVVEALILRAYVEVSRSTEIFRQVTFLTGSLVNVRHETAQLNVKVEELPTSRDFKAVEIRRGFLSQQLHQFEGLGEYDPLVKATRLKLDADLHRVDQAIARAEARPTEANLRAAAARLQQPGAAGGGGAGTVAAPAGALGLRPRLADPHRRGRRAQGGRGGAAGQRGAVPVAGAELLRRHHHPRRRRERPVAQRVAQARLRL